MLSQKEGYGYPLIGTRLLDVYSSYYGGIICVCWSPDGKYILTGGQDDIVSIWSVNERQLVARCQGHHSWVKAVAFDPWRCDDRTYRFGSVGDDCKLLLWDFSVGMLHRPKAVGTRPTSHPAGLTRDRRRFTDNGAAFRSRLYRFNETEPAASSLCQEPAQIQIVFSRAKAETKSYIIQ